MKSEGARHRWTRAAVVAAASLVVAAGIATLALEQVMRDAGRSDLIVEDPAFVTAFVVAMAASTAVGALLAVRRPGNAAGWLFLALGLSIAFSGAAGAYGTYGAVYKRGSLPGAGLAAVWSDGVFFVWIALFTLILLVTPTGRPPSRRWAPVGWMAVVSCGVFMLAATFRERPLDNPPFEGMRGPLSDGPFGEFFNLVGLVAVVAVHAALLAAIVSVVVRWRQAQGEEHRQLRWLLVPLIPFPFFVAAAWVAAAAGNERLLGIFGGGYIAIFPVAAALAIEKTRLYDIDRIISRTVAYTLLSLVVLVSFVGAVVLAGLAGGRATAESVPAAVAATLAAVAVGGLARRKVQDVVDRKFNRRAFDALSKVRAFVEKPDPSRSIEDVLSSATGDLTLRVAYWNDERETWFSGEGVALNPPPASAVHVASPNGGSGAAVAFDSAAASPRFVETLARAARPELENARLRSALELQLAEVRESRERIVSAQVAERRRIERDLHDGSQQRLLALAMNLRATEISGDAEAALRALPVAVSEIQATVRELRELASGLYPGALEEGGLSAAFRELASRAPIPIQLRVVERRFAPLVESSAWFIACEALANVVKHAHASCVTLAAEVDSGDLVLSIEDDGVGGAVLQGNGLRGMADRAEVAGGSVQVRDRQAGGTMVRAVLPCGR